MKKVKQILSRIYHIPALKYVVVCAAGVLIVGFLDENSLWNHLKNRERISELMEEKARYNEVFERDKAQIRNLERNPKAMEKIARERYFMKADDEDIFVLSDDERAPKSVVSDATAQ
jgi:hypothetical protein